MSELSNKYQQIMKDLQSNIKNKEDKDFVMSKFQELSMMFMDVIDRLTYLTELKINDVETKQKKIDEKMAKIEETVDGIENDIYEDDEAYEFEIVCPYCNHEFVTDINSETSKEVECPECHNMIELDWNCEEDDECSSECSCCSHNCVAEDEEEYNIMEDESYDDEADYKNGNSSKNGKQEDDDM